MLVEKYLVRPRHVEVQVFADRHGNAVHLFERDCSVQRRHQKIIEEAPAPDIGSALRRRLGEAAVNAARAIGYEGAGTVEFLLDGGDFYFMEMNTRLQVEHPVTEMITGVDLVEWQFRVALGQSLPLRQDDLAINGHAFEARLYAEDPSRDFLPAAGTLRHLRFPAESPHVRIDGGVREGDEVGIHYDPLIAKLIVWDADRATALARLRRALEGVQVVGVTTNTGFLASLAGHPAFAAADLDTNFIERHRGDLFPERRPASARVLSLACLDVLLRRDREAQSAARRSADPNSPWHFTNGWRLNDDNYHVLTFRDGDATVEVTVHYRPDGILLQLPGEAERTQAAGEIDEAGDLIANLGGVRLKATVVRHAKELTIVCGGTSHTLEIDDPAARAELQEPQRRLPEGAHAGPRHGDQGQGRRHGQPRRHADGAGSHEDGARGNRPHRRHRRPRPLRRGRAGEGRGGAGILRGRRRRHGRRRLKTLAPRKSDGPTAGARAAR